MVSSIALAEVSLDDLRSIGDLVKNEQYELALQKHLWFHEESKSSSGMGGVRLSYAINDWTALGEKYPPAVIELKKIRDNHKYKLSSGKGTFNDFHELSSINRELGEEIQTITLFAKLSEDHPQQASDFYHVVDDLLINYQEFELVDRYMEDPIFKYETLRHSREQSLSYARKHPNKNTPLALEYHDTRFVNETIKLINVLIVLNKASEAREIHQRATSYFKSKKLENLVIPKS